MTQSAANSAGIPTECDILVVGGALVGGTLALALAQQGFRVVLLDSRELLSPDQAVQPIDRRTTAVAAATTTILDAFSLWRDIEPLSCAIESVHVSQLGRFGVLRMHAGDLGVAALGYVFANDHYNACLAPRLAVQPELQIVAPARITAVRQTAAAVELQLDAEGRDACVSAKLLIAADGAASAMRAAVGVGVRETDYQQYALIGSVESECANRNIAYERFTPSGPLAMLPVSPHMSSVVYTVDSSQAEQFRKAAAAARSRLFLDLIQQRFGRRLGDLQRCSQPDIYPLILRTAKQAYSGRTLFIGNALRTLHPVAGQGFNLAVRDMGKLLEILTAAEAREDPGADAVLQSFAAARQRDQHMTVATTDTLARLFRGSNQSFSHLRALGLLGLDSLPPLKRLFARHAMGYGSPLPDLHYPH